MPFEKTIQKDTLNKSLGREKEIFLSFATKNTINNTADL